MKTGKQFNKLHDFRKVTAILSTNYKSTRFDLQGNENYFISKYNNFEWSPSGVAFETCIINQYKYLYGKFYQKTY